MIHCSEQLAVASGCLLMLNLRSDCWSMALVSRSFLLWSWSSEYAAAATVEANMRIVVVDNRLVINVGDVCDVDVSDTAVVKEAVTLPISAVETIARVSKSVIDATVKSDVGSPVSLVPGIKAVVPTPVSGSPELTDGSKNPRARNPVVAFIVIPCPVAGRPDIPLSWTQRLSVNRQRRGTDSYRNSDPEMSMGHPA